MVSVTRKIEFCAGHRVVGHEGKCKQLHGHQYTIFVFMVSETGLDTLGRVIDFSVIKNRLGKWIDQNWDHGMILFSEDGDAIKAVATIPDHKSFLLPANPTAENIGKYLFEEICPMVFTGLDLKVVKIEVHETPNCYATITE